MRFSKYTIYVLVIVLLTNSSCRLSPKSDMPNVILISIDTLRGSNLGCYGYRRNTSPAIDSLAQTGTMWADCQAQSPWTLPSHATMWTGLSEAAHKTSWYDDEMHVLDPSLPTIASVLHGEGYRTAAFTNICYLSPEYGFDREFDHFSWYPDGNGRARATVEEVSVWLEENIGNPNPFFMVIHFYDVHMPYNPPPPYDTEFIRIGMGVDSTTWWDVTEDGELLNPDDLEQLLALYDGEVRWVDSQLGVLFGNMRELGLDENTIIIITSDHGEEFLEHGGWGHGQTLYQEQLHVPLIITGPGIPADSVNTNVAGLWDIFPTITGLLGYETPANVEGRDLFDIDGRRRSVPAGAVGPDRYLVVEDIGQVFEPREMAAVRIGFDKIIWDIKEDSMEAFNLAEDPDEFRILLPAVYLIDEVENYRLTPPQCSPPPVSGESNDVLQDLGYIN